MLEARQLRYFVAVAEHRHFGRAADSLNVVQSAVSAQISQLEDRFGVRLLTRGKRAAVGLTEAGRLFLTEAKAALQSLERAEQIGRLAGRGEVGRVEIAYVASVAMTGSLARILRQFRLSHPLVELRVTPMDTPSQLAALAQGRIDVGLIRPRLDYPAGLVTQVFHEERLSIALATGHPLTAHAQLTAAALEGQAFIIPQFAEDEGFAGHLLHLAQVGGFETHTVHRVGDFITALSMAAGGYGVVLGPASMERFAIGGLVFREASDFTDRVQLAAAWRSDGASPSTRAFVEAAMREP
uniref:LysR family transcriptional regulator n=1 Tax=uncultured Caulobacter sp. TaxID=158749 RepID=UPI0026007B53|nr:LysR family transcriptional regulator [uncultured Caulobacter sp.]